jgi:hypothetical protein
MTPIESHMSLWLNVTTLLVAVGAIFYVSLWPYMTGDDE